MYKKFRTVDKSLRNRKRVGEEMYFPRSQYHWKWFNDYEGGYFIDWFYDRLDEVETPAELLMLTEALTEAKLGGLQDEYINELDFEVTRLIGDYALEGVLVG